MAKRRAERSLLHGAPPKRCHLSLSGVDQPQESMAPTGGVSPPSLLDLMDTRCRKRPRCPEEDPKKREEGALLPREPADCDTRKHAANLWTPRTSGGFLVRRSFGAPSSSKKRPRGDCAGPEAVSPEANDEAGDYNNTEDGAYNTFQYWRTPLPELNLSLLDDPTHSPSKDEHKYKDPSSEFMET
ncbi:uncharacterized protein C9orf40 homolog [Spinachia spinachia]